MDKQPIDKERLELGSSMFCRLIRRQTGEISSSSLDGGEYVGDQSSLLSLQPWVFRKESYGNDEETIRTQGEFSGRNDYGLYGLDDSAQTESPPRSIRLDCGPRRCGRSFPRSRLARRDSVRPPNAGNCLIPQLYDQHFEIDEYVFSLPQSQTAGTMRPFIVTDGSRRISKSSNVPLGKQIKNGLHEEVCEAALGAKGDVVGFASHPVRTPKRKSRDDRHEGLESSGSRRYCNLSHSQGSPDRMLIFSLGISIGVITTILTNRREVEKLNNLLKHTENLVQDLQDELDMKESMTVKELVNEASESQELQGSYANLTEAADSFHNRIPVSCLHSQENYQYDQPYLPRTVEISNSMSKIEAELEAELERLELNMDSCLEGEVSALGEHDSDLIGDIVHGELRADMFDSRVRKCQADSDRDNSSTSTADAHNPDYSVSPRELSLRLHELIQHRLEERIRELERELQHSQKQLRFIEAERVISQGTFSDSDVESTDQESPVVIEQDSALAQPLRLNLSGDALNAYEEAYEEFMRMTATEETRPSTTDMKKQLYGDGFYATNRSLIWGMEGDHGNKASTDVEYIEGEPTWKRMLSISKESDDPDECNGGDEYEIDDDEGKMIQQIVEQTRQGSPVVLNAHRMLFSMDE